MWSQGTILQVLQWTNECWHRCEPHLIPAAVPFHWWCPIWSFMSSHLWALQLAPCPPLIQSQCCLCISYDCALWSGASPCSPEQTCCRPEDSTVIQAISVLKSVVVWASSLAGFMWSSGLCLKSDTLILFFLITNKQLQSCLLVVFWLVGLFACFVKP